MTHRLDCPCINCKAKGSPIQEIWLRDVTIEALSTIEIFDWLEGYGQVMSLAGQKLIRKYGFMLIKSQDEVRKLKGEKTMENDMKKRMEDVELAGLQKQNLILDVEIELLKVQVSREEVMLQIDLQTLKRESEGGLYNESL